MSSRPAGPESPTPASPDAKGGRLRAVLGILIASGLLAYALAQVPLEDRLRAGPNQDEVILDLRLELDGGRWRGADLAGRITGIDTQPTDPAAWRDLAVGDRVEVGLAEGGDGQGAPDTVAGIPIPWLELRPGLPSLLRTADPLAFPASLATLALATLLIATRWWRLLRALGCGTTWRNGMRITWTSLFFNVALPGLSGGDVARAWIAVRGNPEKREAALVSVAADRVFGLWAMTLVALCAVTLGGSRFEALRVPVALAAGGLSVGWLLYSFGPLGSWVTPERLARLPLGERLVQLEGAGGSLARNPPLVGLALVLSSLNHLACALSIWLVASGLGSDLGFLEVLVVSTVANTLSAIPVAPAGLGVGELLFGSLFELAGGSWAIGVATSLAWRLVLVGLGLLGGAGALLPGGRQLHREFRSAATPVGDFAD